MCEARSIGFVLGRADQPTDAVGQYSNRLAYALRRRGTSVEILACRWDVCGWRSALQQLKDALRSRYDAILIHHTHLMWDREGLPGGFIRVVRAVGARGTRLGVILHDPSCFGGRRIRDRLRDRFQVVGMKAAVRKSQVTFATVDPDVLPWATEDLRHSMALLPVGSNIPVVRMDRKRTREDEKFVVAVFGVRDDASSEQESMRIIQLLERVRNRIGDVRVTFFGRGTQRLVGCGLETNRGVLVDIHGIVSSSECSRIMDRADVSLLLRGTLSSRRSSAIAAISHGVPVIGWRGRDTGWPLTEAGIVAVPFGDVEGVAENLVRLATEESYSAHLRAKNKRCYGTYFAWERIAERLEATLWGR